jgi:hypothetical protein
MQKEPTTQLSTEGRDNYRDTEQLIAEMNELIARIKHLRICIALYLVSNVEENRKFPFRETSGKINI